MSKRSLYRKKVPLLVYVLITLAIAKRMGTLDWAGLPMRVPIAAIPIGLN